MSLMKILQIWVMVILFKKLVMLILFSGTSIHFATLTFLDKQSAINFLTFLKSIQMPYSRSYP